MLKVTVQKSGNEVVLHCAGRIVHGEEEALLCAAVKQHARTIVLDFSQVEAIDAAGMGLLVCLQAAGIYLKVLNAGRSVRDLLRLTRLDSVLEVVDVAAEGDLRPGNEPGSIFAPDGQPAARAIVA